MENEQAVKRKKKQLEKTARKVLLLAIQIIITSIRLLEIADHIFFYIPLS